MLRDLPPPTIPSVHLGSDNKALAWFHNLHHFSCTKQPALEESTHLSASSNRKTLSPKQRGTASPAPGPFHNTYLAATPAMGCWRILKKIKYLHKDEARLGQICWWDFWASNSHSFTWECVQKGHRTSFFGAVEQHKGTCLPRGAILFCFSNCIYFGNIPWKKKHNSAVCSVKYTFHSDS